MAFSPGDAVEAFDGAAWRPGHVCAGNPPQPGDPICVTFPDGTSDDFLEENVRPAG